MEKKLIDQNVTKQKKQKQKKWRKIEKKTEKKSREKSKGRKNDKNPRIEDKIWKKIKIKKNKRKIKAKSWKKIERHANIRDLQQWFYLNPNARCQRWTFSYKFLSSFTGFFSKLRKIPNLLQLNSNNCFLFTLLPCLYPFAYKSSKIPLRNLACHQSNRNNFTE